jgi:hypothetical protein
MTFILLTGAGFSRNWGGLLADEAFEYLLGSVRRDHTGLHSFLNMSLMEARRRNASALRLRFSQSFANRLQRPSLVPDRQLVEAQPFRVRFRPFGRHNANAKATTAIAPTAR